MTARTTESRGKSYFTEGGFGVTSLLENFMCLGLASFGVDEQFDKVETVQQKRLAVHVAIAVGFQQLVSTVLWTTSVAIPVFIVLSLFGLIFSMMYFLGKKDHIALRWYLPITGALYCIIFFGSEGCQLLARSGGRIMFLIAPNVLFHIPMGGSQTGGALLLCAPVVVYTVLAIVEGTSTLSTTPCFELTPSSRVENVHANIFVQAVWPLIIVGTTAVLLFEKMRRRLEEDDAREVYAAELTIKIEAEEWKEARASVQEHVKTLSLRHQDVVMALSVSAACAFHDMIPRHMLSRDTPPASESAGVGAVTLTSLPLPPIDDETRKKSPDHAKKSPRSPTIRANGGRRGSRHFPGAVETTDDDDPFPAPPGRSPGVKPGTPEYHDDGELPGGNLTTQSRPAVVRRPSLHNLHQSFRRGSAGSIMLPMEKRRQYLMMVSLPRLAIYLENTVSSMDMTRLMLNEYLDCVMEATESFKGRYLFSAWCNVYCAFDSCNEACGASLYTVELMKRAGVHHTEPVFASAAPNLPFIVVCQSDTTAGVVGGDGSQKTIMGWSRVEGTLVKLKEYFALSLVTPPVVLMPNTLDHLVRNDFKTVRCDINNFYIVEKAWKMDEKDRPVVENRGEVHEFAETHYDVPDIDDLVKRMITGVTGEDEEAREEKAKVDEAMGLSQTHGLSKQKTMRKKIAPEVQKMWERFDMDGNGHLDYEEVKDVFNGLGIFMSEQEMKDFFHEVDADKSGTITFDEFARSFFTSNVGGAAAMAHVKKAAQAMKASTGVDQLPVVLSVWKKYDTDNSGSLETSEIHNVLKDLGIVQTMEEVEFLVAKLDTNQSGTIELEEFAALFSEEHADTKANVVRSRIQNVERIMENKTTGQTFSNAEQNLRDDRSRFAQYFTKYFSPVLFVYIVYSYGQNSFRIAMQGEEYTTTGQIIADMVSDIIFYVWFGLKMTVLVREDNGQVIFKGPDIRANYMTTLEFVIDVAVLIPFDIIYLGIDDRQKSSVYGMYRMNKILLLYHLDDIYMNIAASFNPIVTRVSDALLWFIMVSHGFACAAIMTARSTGETTMLDLVGTNRLISNRSTTYLLSILWAFQTLGGQLRGEAIPPELDEQLYLMFGGVLVGVPLLAGLLGVIGNAMAIETSESRFLSNIDALRGYFSYARDRMGGASEDRDGFDAMEQESIMYYRHIYNTTGSLELTEDPLSDVPFELQIQVTVAIGQEMLSKVPIFQTAAKDPRFVHELTIKLTPQVIEPDTIVMKKGQKGSNMYFISYGDFHVVIPGVGVVFTFGKGGFFGEIALLHDVKRTATIQCGSKRYANVFTLERRDFMEVMATFPDALSAINKAAEQRLKEALEKEREEERKAKEEKERQKAEERARLEAETEQRRIAEEADAREMAARPIVTAAEVVVTEAQAKELRDELGSTVESEVEEDGASHATEAAE